MANLSKPTIAAFDFDGTLTYHDSLLPFLRFIKGDCATIKNIFLEIPLFILYLIGKANRQKVKEALLSRFLKGMSKQEIEIKAQKFAREIIPQKLRPQALERIHWHQKQGHRCILISANLDIYLKPWGQLVKFDRTITSKVAFSKEDFVTGKLEGLNCRGEEKVRRLLAEEGPREHYILYAYGDSAGDKELLDIADYPFYQRLS
ncbi:MAG: protein CicA [Chlamydiales bacterium 38-26]|nr:HAD family hydrolase [Chlamydiales bacterium]OJV11062.1 MAG: protein CicA [Chlamydiales bacterium 38-26]